MPPARTSSGSSPSVSASGPAAESALTKMNGPQVSTSAGRRPSSVAVEVRVGVGPRRRPQRAVEPVGPGVVVALERRAAALPRHHLRAAVAADVHERAQLALAVADDDQRHVARAQREVGAGLGELPEVAGVLPGAGEQPLALAREHLVVDVPAVGQRVRARQPKASRARSPGPRAPATAQALSISLKLRAQLRRALAGGVLRLQREPVAADRERLAARQLAAEREPCSLPPCPGSS